MEMTRRQLIVLGGAMALTGCAAGNGSQSPATPASAESVDAGPLSEFTRRGTDGRFRDTHGFYLVRTRTRLYAQSAVCTHRNCKIDPTATGFLCRCHGSTFTPDGTVTKGQWSKPDNGTQISFTDANGQPLALNPGQTWLTALSDSSKVSYK